MKKLFIFLTCIIPLMGQAQEKNTEPKYGISFSGFVKTDFFFDSREVYTIREGDFLLFPKEKVFDANGIDINDKSSFNFLSIQSRLTGKITGPDAFGAKTSGVLEADFFGNENAAFIDANGFRLRHAFVKLNWPKTELLAGQFWHAFFIPECFSGVISFNTGAPFQPFSRNPQIRVTQTLGKFKVAAVIAAQRDFTSPQGSVSLQHAGIPNVSALISYNHNSNETTTNAGVGVDYKTLQPLLTTTKNNAVFVTDEKVAGFSATAYFKRQSPTYTFKLQGIYGENLFDLIMLGGYAVHNITDTTKNTVSYTTLNQFTAWSEFQTNGKKVQFGLWAGYSQNLGSKKSILYYSNKVAGTDATIRGANIQSLIRISPRIVFIQGKFNFATELEYTSASYATKNAQGQLNRDANGVITASEKVNNLRLLFSAIYYF
ncbi:MAG: outer membrane protein [Bacteroidetes bacterium]|nr:MAG: outer membrane protein [Bacteroidota bacterium]